MNSITFHRDFPPNEADITIPVGRSCATTREIGTHATRPDLRVAIDVALVADPIIGLPCRVKILLRTDGTWAHWATDFYAGDGTSGNHYWHIYQVSEGRLPTEEQRRTIAGWFLGENRPYGAPLGASVMNWAFPEIDAQEISRRYGDGRTVYLA